MSSRNLFPYLVKLFRCQQCPPSLISFFEVLLIPLSELGGGLLLYHRNRRTSLCCLQVGATAQPFFCLVPRALFLCASLQMALKLPIIPSRPLCPYCLTNCAINCLSTCLTNCLTSCRTKCLTSCLTSASRIASCIASLADEDGGHDLHLRRYSPAAADDEDGGEER